MPDQSARISESAIEDLAIQWLESLGYIHKNGPDIAPDGSSPLRDSFEEVLLLEKVASAVDRINPSIPKSARSDALKQIQKFLTPELIANNESFHRLLTEGINITYQDNGNPTGRLPVADRF